MAHHRMWLFRPPAGREAEFSTAYAADGAWSALFRQGEGYLGTRLLRASEPAGWWMTIDSWSDEKAFAKFHEQHGPAYKEMDGQLEGVAGEEQFVGAFDD